MSTAMLAVFEAAEGLKLAADLIKSAMAAGDALDKAEMRFKLADALNALADAKNSVTDAKEELQQAYKELDEMHEKLKLKAKTVRFKDGYYELDGEGAASGDPYCSKCWEVDHRLVHLVRGDRTEQFTYCPSCKQKYSRWATPFELDAEIRKKYEPA
ncbi:hypothetical protein [Agrilutibacter solisilvae]|uniref:Uncharacterized protein n=1 Tax=Agrilutibacter solisilvae TaxID=2763317 RepID=A0A974Y036_9GAMM|nr:hypothetical protein [Lysobacter solisilvae]QSX78108.1 hypothetical protein I8J32_015635 [Lysobacter solisilvae]